MLLFALLGAITQPALAASSSQSAPPASQTQDPSRTQQFIHLASGWMQGSTSTADEQKLAQPDPDLVVYLTFDDGPDPKWTPQVLELLQQYHAIATFFEIGYNVKQHPEITRQIAEDGHTIGLHGYYHLDFAQLDYSELYFEVEDNQAILEELLGTDPQLVSALTPCLRPPYRSVNQMVKNFAEELNYELSFWQIDTEDWSDISSSDIFSTVAIAVEPYAIILMHDGGGNRLETIRALELVLHELTLRGYSFAPYCTASGQAFTP